MPTLRGEVVVNRENLEKLAAYLATGATRMQFDMSVYCVSDDDDVLPIKHNCGTIGCAAGHGPSAGLKGKRGEDWGEYCERVFGISQNEDAWKWCFDCRWELADNTPEGAAARIRWMLEKGVPNNFYDQMWKEAPLCYRAPRTEGAQ